MDASSSYGDFNITILAHRDAVGRGHPPHQNWAVIASLIETCKLNAVDPHAWLAATLTAIVQGHKQSDIDALLPWKYKEAGDRGHAHEHHRDQGHA